MIVPLIISTLGLCCRLSTKDVIPLVIPLGLKDMTLNSSILDLILPSQILFPVSYQYLGNSNHHLRSIHLLYIYMHDRLVIAHSRWVTTTKTSRDENWWTFSPLLSNSPKVTQLFESCQVLHCEDHYRTLHTVIVLFSLSNTITKSHVQQLM